MDTYKVCRTCLKQLHKDCDIIYLDSTNLISLRHKLLNVFPETNLSVTPEAVVCNTCSVTINDAYEFKKKCLEVELKIHTCLQKSNPFANFVDLMEIQSINHESKIVLKQEPDVSFDKDNESHSKLNEISQDGLKYAESLQMVDINTVEFNTGFANFCANNETAAGESFNDNCRTYTEDKESYTCYNCGFCAIHKEDLIEHIKTHNGSHNAHNISKCSTLDKHELNVYNSEESKCKEQKLYEDSESHSDEHLTSDGIHSNTTSDSTNLKNRNGKLFKCDVCGFCTNFKQHFSLHLKKHLGEKLKCSLCKFETYYSEYLKVHIAEHSEEKPFKCAQCDFKAAHKRSLQCHMINHSVKKSHKCKLCDYSCARGYNLKIHMRIHSQEKPYKCSYCDYSTTQQGHLNIHMRRHTNDKPYKCETCGYETISKTSLIRHINIHVEDKPYKCSKCNYATTQPSHLKIHLRQHTGEKPYACSICKFKTGIKNTLDLHMRTHTGEKPYKCTKCDYASTQATPLKVHLRKKHGAA